MSLRRIILDALDDQLSINSALPRSLALLLAKPGTLTIEYLRGRIARYIPPFRLYLAASVLFFLTLSLLSAFRPTTVRSAVFTTDADSVALQRPIAGSRPLRVVTEGTGPFFGVRIDSVADTTLVYVNMGHPRLSEAVGARVQTLAGLSPAEIGAAIVPPMIERAPLGMFILLPLFAGLLKLLYIRSGRYYVEHFVFALHTHAFTFLAFTALVLLPDTSFDPLILLWVLIYYLVAMKRVYRQGIVVTTVKAGVLSFVYSFLVGIVVLGILAAAVLLG